MQGRIGVYVCQCGPNIKDALDIERVVAAANAIKEVVLARSFRLLCSKEGRDLIKEDIQAHRLTHIVIAACSPKEHERTFQKILKAAGLNPYFLQMANIREQGAWVCGDKRVATEKAVSLTRAAIRRVLHHAPLAEKEIDCQTDVLVVGAGVAGISAALTLAQAHRRVYLVEKSPCIGGHAALYEAIGPRLACASCLLEPMLDQVLHHDQIDVFTYSEVTGVLGGWGNLLVQIQKKARFIDETACIGCRACIDACPEETPNEFDQFLGNRKAVYIPYEGALPHIACIDKEKCLHFKDKACRACASACPFEAVNLDQKDAIMTVNVGAVVLAVGFDLFSLNESDGCQCIANLYTPLAFERILNSNGPTQGRVQLQDGTPPKRIAFIHCVGSRSEKHHSHCSGICCAYLLKFALMVHDQLPDIIIEQFYTDFCLPGKEAQNLLTQARKLPRFTLRPMRATETISFSTQDQGIAVSYRDVQNTPSRVMVDMVVLGPAMTGAADADALSSLFGISQDTHHFFKEADPLDPVASTQPGIFIAGCCQGPQNVPQSISQGQAAAGRILQHLVPGHTLPLPTTVTKVDEDRCSGCKTCMGLCEFGAIDYNEHSKQVAVNPVLCQGCGTCAAGCPSGAMTADHFTDNAVSAEIEGLLEK
jgi:heterodisulfide reductase subunit A